MLRITDFEDKPLTVDLIKEGEALFAEGKIEEAEKCFIGLLEENPENGEVLNNLGVLHHFIGNFNKAEDYLLKALSAKEDYPDALLNLANLFQDTKRWKEASVQLKKYTEINDQDPNPLNQLGMVYLEMGDTEKTRMVLKKSLELKPDQETVRDSLKTLEKKASPSMDCNGEIEKGKTLFAEGKIEEAKKCFLDIINQDSKNAEAYNNLGVIALQRQNIEQAFEYFTKALGIDPFYRYAILNYSEVLRILDRLHLAIPILTKAIQKHPNDRELSQLLNEAHLEQRPKAKIAVLCLPGLQSFLGDIVDYLKTKYKVNTCYSNNQQEIESTVCLADIVWLEWANELAIALTNHPTLLDGKRIICRLHSYEALVGYVGKIKWERIDDLIFVAEHIKRIVLQQVPNLVSMVKNIHIIPNGVNLNKFPFIEKEPGYNIAYVGYINYKKGPMLLLHAFQALVQLDNRYRLFIAGDFQDARYDLYFKQMIKEMDLTDNIQIEGWINDVPVWLEDKQYILCTSVLEGHPVGLMEAMSCGLKPVIHNFVGARGSYPDKYLWNTIPEFVGMVTEDDYNSEDYRNFIERNYSLDIQLERIQNIIKLRNEQKE